MTKGVGVVSEQGTMPSPLPPYVTEDFRLRTLAEKLRETPIERRGHILVMSGLLTPDEGDNAMTVKAVEYVICKLAFHRPSSGIA